MTVYAITDTKKGEHGLRLLIFKLPHHLLTARPITGTNIFPNTWKMADIRAIYKQKGSKTDPNNYRPISVLPILGRTLEKLAGCSCPTISIL